MYEICIRPDITYAVGVFSRFMIDPGELHSNVVKGILRYLKGTSILCLCFGSGDNNLEGNIFFKMHIIPVMQILIRKSTHVYPMNLCRGHYMEIKIA